MNYVALLWIEVGQPSFTHSLKAWRYLNTRRNIYGLQETSVVFVGYLLVTLALDIFE